MTRSAFTITPHGPFSLLESATFGFGQREAAAYDGVMRLAFCADGEGYGRQVGIVLRQDADGQVHGDVDGDAGLEAVRIQVARVLSLDHDARGFVALGERDLVMAELREIAEAWRPFRAWATVLLRAAGPRVLGDFALSDDAG